MISKILFILVSIFYFTVAYLYTGVMGLWVVFFYILLPFLCIWSPGEPGRLLGIFKLKYPGGITSESPAGMIRFFGWVLLLLPIIYGLFRPQIIKFFIG